MNGPRAGLLTCPECRVKFKPGVGPVSACPRCGMVVVVPQELVTTPELAPIKTDRELAVTPVVCKLCNSRYYATASQVGKTLQCPDCHTINFVVAASTSKNAEATAPQFADGEDDFRLSEPVEKPKYQALSKEAMYLEEAISGTRPAIAPAKSELVDPNLRPAAESDDDDDFRLSKHDEPRTQRALTNANPASPARPIVPPRASSKPNPANPLDIDLFDQDQLPPAALPLSMPDPPKSELVSPQPEKAASQLELPEPDVIEDDGSEMGEFWKRLTPGERVERRELSKAVVQSRPFSAGIIGVLFQPNVFSRWLIVVILATANGVAGSWVLNTIAQGGGAQIVAVLIYSAMCLPSIFGLVFLGIICFSTFEDTADGHDTVVSFPELLGLEWFGALWLMFVAAFLSSLPGAFGSYALIAAGSPIWVAPLFVFPSMALLFPVLFISMVEGENAASLVSAKLIKSFGPLIGSWATFYILSFAMCLLALVIAIFMFERGLWTIIPSCLVLVAMPVVYFRLLGRIAMIYREYLMDIEDDEIEEEIAPKII